MSQKTFSVRITKSVKDKIENCLVKIAEDTGFKKGKALEYVFDAYIQMLLEGKAKPDEYIEPDIQDVLTSINCDYLLYDGKFFCLERYHNKKERDIIGIEPSKVKDNCMACLKGKQDIIKHKITEQRRKESFRKLHDFLKQFIVITEKGIIANAYMCTYDALDGKFHVSKDGKSLRCPLEEDEYISIKEVCFNRVNPKKEMPPCQYLITLEHIVKLTKADLETMDIDIPVIEYEEPEELSSHTLNTEHRKKVEADFKIQEDEDKLKSEKEKDKEKKEEEE